LTRYICKFYGARRDVTPEIMPGRQIINAVIARGAMADPIAGA